MGQYSIVRSGTPVLHIDAPSLEIAMRWASRHGPSGAIVARVDESEALGEAVGTLDHAFQALGLNEQEARIAAGGRDRLVPRATVPRVTIDGEGRAITA